MDALLGMAEYIELWLSERGLNPHEISRGMGLLLGEDWKRLSYFELFDRIRARGAAVSDKMPLFADELEALVRGALKLEDIYGADDHSFKGPEREPVDASSPPRQ